MAVGPTNIGHSMGIARMPRTQYVGITCRILVWRNLRGAYGLISTVPKSALSVVGMPLGMEVLLMESNNSALVDTMPTLNDANIFKKRRAGVAKSAAKAQYSAIGQRHQLEVESLSPSIQ